MSVSKEQWAGVESELKKLFGQCRFRVEGRELLVQREGYKEGQTCLVVYIDGEWCFGWGRQDSDLYLPITASIWRKRSKAFYSPKKKAQLIKCFRSAKRARESFPHLDQVQVWYEPIFLKASAVVRQFRRIPNIELISIGYQPKADE